MKHIFYLTAFVLAGNTFAQITNPAPYCAAIYSDDVMLVDHSIQSVELNTLNNTSGTTQYAAPHYVYYNNLPATSLPVNSSQTLKISHSDGITIHGIAAWIDFNGDNDFDDAGEKIGEALMPGDGDPTNGNTLSFPFTVPAGAMPGITRMRIRVYEDDDYTFSGVSLPVLPCQFNIGAGNTDYDWGETEDYNVQITAAGPPVANFTIVNTTICKGDCINFTDASTGGPTTWNWNFGNGQNASVANPSNICYNTAGTYTVTLTAANTSGQNNFSRIITVTDCSAPVASFEVDSMICIDDCIRFTSTSTGTPTTYEWTFMGGTPSSYTGQNPGLICYDNVGTFVATLTVTNAFGTHTAVKPIQVGQYPTIEAIGDTTINMLGTAVLEASGTGGTYLWSPAEYTDCPTCPFVNVTPIVSTDFIVQMISPEGCIDDDTVRVNVNFRDVIDIPSAFSPNADGVNDILYVKGLGIATMKLSIYNRYGEHIFTSEEQSNGWDGTFKGQDLNPANYLYTLEYTLLDGSSNKKSGTVTLVK